MDAIIQRCAFKTIIIQDTSPPELTCPDNISIDCAESTLPGNTGNATASDNCDHAPVINYNDVTAQGSCPQAYTIMRTWKSTDACNNSSTCVQVISLNDSTSPVIICPANVTIECLDNTLPAQNGSATASVIVIVRQ